MALYPSDTPNTDSWRMVPLYHKEKRGSIRYWEISFDERAGCLYTASGVLFTKALASEYANGARGSSFNAALNESDGRDDAQAALAEIDERVATNYRKCILKAVQVVPKSKRSMREQGALELRSRYKKQEDKHAASNDLDAILAGREVSQFRVGNANAWHFPGHEDYNANQLRAEHFEVGVLVQEKQDGCRLTMHLKDGQVVAETRKGLSYAWLPAVKECGAALLSLLPPSTYLDGEIMHPDGIQALRKVVGRSKTRNEDGESQLVYQIFDICVDTEEGRRLPLDDRRRILEVAYDEFDSTGGHDAPMTLLPTVRCHSVDDVRREFDRVIAAGGEGLVIRKLCGGRAELLSESVYDKGTRSNNLLKLKPFEDAEGLIVDVYEGTGTRQGCAIFLVEIAPGKRFGLTPHGTVDECIELYKRKESCIGRYYKYRFNGRYTDDGIPKEHRGIDFRDELL